MLRRRATITKLEKPERPPNVDLDGAYEEDPKRRYRHFSEMFQERANLCLRSHGIDLGPARNWKAHIQVRPEETAAYLSLLQAQGYPRPWIFICPKSNFWAVRTVPAHIWADVAGRLGTGTCFWLGTEPAPPPIVDLSIRHLDNIIRYLALADLLVTVDTGPMHIAAALGIPILALLQSSSPELHLNDQTDFISVPVQGLDCLNCQLDTCPKSRFLPPCQKIDPDYLANAIRSRLRTLDGQTVSIVIPIYRPEAAMLNRCLDHALPQADEVIVLRDQAGILPSGVRSHPKLRILLKEASDIGYGRKANFGFRQSNGAFVLLCNDDLFLAPDAVASMKALMLADPSVGLVSHLLRYPDGTIQHGGTVRAPGQRGWHHLDVRKHISRFTEPVEMENVTGAAILVRRRAYFDADGHDEQFYLCCEDNDLCLKLRKNGYRILFTPLVSSTHLESTSTRNHPRYLHIIRESCAMLESKWGAYWDHNAKRVPLGNFDYLKPS